MLYIPVPINRRNHINAAMSKRQTLLYYNNHGKNTWGEGESQTVRSKLLYEKKGEQENLLELLKTVPWNRMNTYNWNCSNIIWSWWFSNCYAAHSACDRNSGCEDTICHGKTLYIYKHVRHRYKKLLKLLTKYQTDTERMKVLRTNKVICRWRYSPIIIEAIEPWPWKYYPFFYVFQSGFLHSRYGLHPSSVHPGGTGLGTMQKIHPPL